MRGCTIRCGKRSVEFVEDKIEIRVILRLLRRRRYDSFNLVSLFLKVPKVTDDCERECMIRERRQRYLLNIYFDGFRFRR